MKIIPLGLVWRAFEFAKILPKKKEKTRQIVSFYFLILHSPSHWVKQTISKKKNDAIVGLKRKLLFIWSETWKLKIKKKQMKKTRIARLKARDQK